MNITFEGDVEGLVGYHVLKTTTDKLAEMLNGYSEGWTVRQITHVGGRDWVVIAAFEFDNEEHRASVCGE